ncbi:MAG: chaperone NapD [Arcobacter sp.]|nr:chaperone NapD [Arcobacter sp.]
MNISSIVIQAKSEYIDGIVEQIQECNFCEYFLHDKQKGKIIVAIEGESTEDEIRKVKQIEQIPNVISATMMMSYSEEELDKEREKLGMEDDVPQMLNDNTIEVKDIVYNGDLKKKIF